MTQNSLRQQYRTDANLNARIDLHRRFSANPYPWHRWAFDQLALPADAHVLELGCGPADLWRENVERIPARWDITLTDFSGGRGISHRQGRGDVCGAGDMIALDRKF